jgi:hypothetical protein
MDGCRRGDGAFKAGSTEEEAKGLQSLEAFRGYRQHIDGLRPGRGAL